MVATLRSSALQPLPRKPDLNESNIAVSREWPWGSIPNVPQNTADPRERVHGSVTLPPTETRVSRREISAVLPSGEEGSDRLRQFLLSCRVS
jgi:hypothetical protein